MADSHVNGFPFTEFEDDLAVEVWHSRPSRHKYMIFHAMIEYTAKQFKSRSNVSICRSSIRQPDFNVRK